MHHAMEDEMAITGLPTGAGNDLVTVTPTGAVFGEW